MAHNFNDLCRVCGMNSNKMISLFGIRKKGLTFADMLSICTQSSVQQADRLPSNICNPCLANLEAAFDFHKQVKASEEQFQQILSLDEPAIEIPSIEYGSPLMDISTIDEKYEPKSEPVEEREILISFKVPSGLNQKPNLIANNIATVSTPEMLAHRRDLRARRMQRLFECFMCKAKLKSFVDMRQHLKQHNEATPFKCKVCAMHFSAEHYGQHLCKGQSVQCDYCTESFQTTLSLLEHLECHNGQHKLYKCQDCSRIFPMLFLLNCHRDRQHKIIERPFTCRICMRAFRLANSLTKHRATHSEERRKCIVFFILLMCFPL